MSTPNFFIIGAPKSGTTALAHYLSEHPQVFFAKPKELFYWSSDHPKAKERHNVFSIEDYLQYFRNSDGHVAIGEGSTNYLQSHTAIKNILEFNPKSKFIVLLRDPVDVAYGMHGELLRHYFEDVADFETAWSLQDERANGRKIPRQCIMENQLQYKDVASYASQLERLFDLVPDSQRRVFLFEDFANDAKGVYSKVCHFLDLDDDGRTEFPKMNPARQYRSKLIGKLYQNPPRFVEPAMKKVRRVYSNASVPMRDWIARTLSQQTPRSPLKKGFREQLQETFRPDLERVEKMLDVKLESWYRSNGA